MNLYNIKHPEEQVTFLRLFVKVLGGIKVYSFQKLFLNLITLMNYLNCLLLSVVKKILGALIDGELPQATLDAMVKNAFTFTAPLEKSGR